MTASAAKVAIIGSGVAGATIARGLVARGIGPVVMLEAGPHVPMADHRKWVDYLTTGVLPYDPSSDLIDETSTAAAARDWMHGSRLIARGGSTLHWGGWSPRMRPEDFALRSGTGRGTDWPLSYGDLEPYYGRAEQLLGVAGDSTDMSFERSTPFPFGPIPFTAVDGEAIRGFEALDYGYSHMPIARNVRAHGTSPGCQTIGTCRYCPIGARYSANQTLDELEHSPLFELRVNTTVDAILMNRRQQSRGVAYTDRTTARQGQLEAEVVIICAGAVESPKLLLNSISPEWPAGIGNDSDHVGRHLTYHPMLHAKGTRRSNPAKLQRELDFTTLCSRHFDNETEQAGGKLFMVLPPVRPLIDLAAMMKMRRSRDEVNSAVTGPLTLEIQGFMETFPDAESRVIPGKKKDRFGLPGTDIYRTRLSADNKQLQENLQRMARVLSTAGYANVETGVYRPRGDHAAATCRMSASDTDGVVNSDLRVHDVDNLYICSNAVFPSLGAVNPTLTLTALALRMAEQLSVG